MGAKVHEAPAPVLRLGCFLGEGPVWDSRSQRLYFVDILASRVYTYEPSTGRYGFETFEEPISCLALRENEPGLVGTATSSFVLLSAEQLPFPPTNSTTPRSLLHLTTSLPKDLMAVTARFNDGACDPAGNFFAGTLGQDMMYCDGVLFRLDALTAGVKLEDLIQDAKFGEVGLPITRVIEGITCSNGLGWTKDGSKMYYTDSFTGNIVSYKYDPSSATLSRKRMFRIGSAPEGAPDGLCLDTEDGVWSARWQAGEIHHYDTKGTLLDVIKFPHCRNITSCIFGGKDMDDLYVTTASNSVSGEDPASHPEGGDLFVLKGLGKGVERGRYLG